MNLKAQINALNILYKLVNGGKISDLMPPKPRFKPAENKGKFEELLPEQTGVRSEGLLKMISALSEDSGICPHSIVVLKDGKLVAKADWKPFSSRYLHVSHSLCKSVTAMAVGIAVKEKYLSEDEKITEIFQDELPDGIHPHMDDITVKHLLTMSGGVKFNEAGAVTGDDWIKKFLSSEVLFKPGSSFRYNSLNSYMLSAAVCRRTGLSLSDYLKRRLFTPMGITDFYWEKSPDGIEKGGWGLYMSVFDYAKLGQLYLNGGKWNGIELVPSDWVKKSVSPQISKPDSGCCEGYGYQTWLTKNRNGFVFSGMFGQNVFVFPKRGIVIALTAGSSNLFPSRGSGMACRAMNIVTEFIENGKNFSCEPIKDFRYGSAAVLRKALSGASFGKPLPTDGGMGILAGLRKSLSGGKAAEAVMEAVKLLDGVELDFEKNRAGLTPVLIQIMSGSFAGGIEKAVFEISGTESSARRRPEILSAYRRYIAPRGSRGEPAVYSAGNAVSPGGGLVIRFERDGRSVRVPVSFTDRPAYFDFEDFEGGGSYLVGVNGSFTTDEDDIPVLRVAMCFVETSCTKVLKFIFGTEDVTLKMRESPQLYGAIDEAAETVLPSLGKGARRTIEAILETDAAEYKIKSFLEPTLKGRIISSDIHI
ncbi:MAG: beta-lactamase family protein [Prevotella sp.]|nr:beta-lactamase family protein [Prevotella sp.]